MPETLPHAPTVDPDLLADAFRAVCPFASLPVAARLEQLRRSGMHGSQPDDHVGCGAFDIRADLNVGDACETVDQILRQLQATLDVLSASAHIDGNVAIFCTACSTLAKQAGGVMAVIMAAIFPADLR